MLAMTVWVESRQWAAFELPPQPHRLAFDALLAAGMGIIAGSMVKSAHPPCSVTSCSAHQGYRRGNCQACGCRGIVRQHGARNSRQRQHTIATKIDQGCASGLAGTANSKTAEAPIGAMRMGRL